MPNSSRGVVSVHTPDLQIPVAARSIEILRAKVGRVRPIAATRNNNALIVEPGDYRRQVWVRPTYKCYNAAYLKLHMPFYNPRVGNDGLANMDVDHIYNSARAKLLGYEYVRLILCPSEVNRGHGRGIERRLTAVARRNQDLLTRDDQVGIAFAKNWQVAKMAGILIDRNSPSYDQENALRLLRANDLL